MEEKKEDLEQRWCQGLVLNFFSGVKEMAYGPVIRSQKLRVKNWDTDSFEIRTIKISESIKERIDLELTPFDLNFIWWLKVYKISPLRERPRTKNNFKSAPGKWEREETCWGEVSFLHVPHWR